MFACQSQEFFSETFYNNDQVKQDWMCEARLKHGGEEKNDFC
jgi:hypothetical protein